MVSTKNRSDFLIRLLNYYAAAGYKYWISIGDSSDSFHFAKTEEAVKKLEGRLKIRHYKHSGLILSASVKKLAELVVTPYTAFIADDDFLIPNSLNCAIRFLEDNHEYIGATGRAVQFTLQSSGPYGKFSSVGYYKQGSVDAATASERLKNHLNDYFVTLFSVYRTHIWPKIYKNVLDMKCGVFANELLPCSLAAIYGKIKQLDCLYLVRQVHDQRYPLPDAYDWITGPNWFHSYQLFHDSLVEVLMQQDDISKQEADEVVKQAFWSVLKTSLNIKFQAKYCVSRRERLKRIPGLAVCVRGLRSLFFSSKTPSLRSMLNSRSVYTSDFMPVYRVVTEK